MFTVFVLEFTCVFKWYVSVFIAQKALRVGWFPGSVVLVIAMTWAFLRRCDFLANASTSQGISEKGYDSRADFNLHSTLDSPRDLAIFYWLHWPNPWQFDLANVFKSEYRIEWVDALDFPNNERRRCGIHTDALPCQWCILQWVASSPSLLQKIQRQVFGRVETTDRGWRVEKFEKLSLVTWILNRHAPHCLWIFH